MMEIAISESIYQELARHTALLARIEEEAEGNNYGMYISHDETEESSGLWDDDPNPEEGCNCEQDDCSYSQEDKVMLHEYWEELTGQESIGTFNDPPSTGDRIDEWIESGLRPNHDWPVHYYHPKAQEQVVRTSYKRALSPDMQLEEKIEENQYDTWMNLDIFDYF
jgi:hypothetical protein